MVILLKLPELHQPPAIKEKKKTRPKVVSRDVQQPEEFKKADEIPVQASAKFTALEDEQRDPAGY